MSVCEQDEYTTVDYSNVGKDGKGVETVAAPKTAEKKVLLGLLLSFRVAQLRRSIGS